MLCLLATLAFAEPTALPLERLPARESVPAPLVEVPEPYEGVRNRLRARHPQDVPSLAQLQRDPLALSALQWLARHDSAQIVQERALLLLADAHDPQSRAVCVERTTAAPGKVRAAAVRCVGRSPSEGDHVVLIGLIGDADPRVGVAVVDALWASRPELLEGVALEALPPATRDHLRKRQEAR